LKFRPQRYDFQTKSPERRIFERLKVRIQLQVSVLNVQCYLTLVHGIDLQHDMARGAPVGVLAI
jgi:hypothetical protein